MVIFKLNQRFILAIALLVSLVLWLNTAKAELTASVDRTVIQKNDIIQLTIRSDSGPIQHSDFSELEQYFSVINRQRSNQISIINGKQTAIYELRLALFPINAGRFTIPAFSSRGESSKPIQITVSDTPTDSAQQPDEVFLKASISKQQAYVQEPLVFTLQLFHAVGLSEAQLSSLDIENAIIEEIGKQTKREQILNGVRYSVIEKQYSITPEKSGQLTIPELTFTGRTSFRSNYGQPGRYVRTRSLAHSIEVLPKPDSYPVGEPWLPTPALSISDSWASGTPSLTVGESVTRTLTLSALNLEAAQLPDVALPEVAGLKMYPDQSRNENNPTQSGILGQRIFSTAIVATQPGEIEIPASKIVWWNTSSKQLEETVIPAVTLAVKAAANTGNQIATAPTQDLIKPPVQSLPQGEAPSRIWPYLSALLALLWLATLFLWWQSTRKSKIKAQANSNDLLPNPKEQSSRAAFKAFKKACRDNNASSTRQALIDWFKTSHTDQPQQGLQGIANFYQDAELSRAITSLESSLYSSNGTSWQGDSLFQIVERLEKSYQQQAKTKKGNDLKPLYPF